MPAEQSPWTKPPIHEVVCGFHYHPLALSNPFILADFVERQKENGFEYGFISNPIENAPGFRINIDNNINVIPFRLILESKDKRYVIQIQNDRLLFNWRRTVVDSPYPTFSGRGSQPGIRQLAMAAFADFSRCISEKLGRPPVCRKVQLNKYDHFERTLSPGDLGRISELIPMLSEAGVPPALPGRQQPFDISGSPSRNSIREPPST